LGVHFRLRNSRDKTYYPLTGLIKQMGRSMDCDIVVADPQVSRLHARLDKNEDGWILLDLESQNGTTVNGVRVREKILEPGDVIQVGAAQFIFEIDEAVSASEDSTKVDPVPVQAPGVLDRIFGRKSR
jgi:pSer/pThr/pTyr-binding forkhead associated (FHA) protein